MANRRDGDRLDLTLAGTWRKDDEPRSRAGRSAPAASVTSSLPTATADALFALLSAVPATLARLERERDRLRGEVEDLTRDRDAQRRKPESPAARPALAAVTSERTGSSSLADVPLAMIGTFRADDPRVKAAAKKDPLMALAVQVAKATAPDASELEGARLRAMATAVSRGDLKTFWGASTERSRKKLGGALASARVADDADRVHQPAGLEGQLLLLEVCFQVSAVFASMRSWVWKFGSPRLVFITLRAPAPRASSVARRCRSRRRARHDRLGVAHELLELDDDLLLVGDAREELADDRLLQHPLDLAPARDRQHAVRGARHLIDDEVLHRAADALQVLRVALAELEPHVRLDDAERVADQPDVERRERRERRSVSPSLA